MSGSHSHGSLVLRWWETHPDWFIYLLPRTWLLLKTWEFMCWSEFVSDTRVRTANVVLDTGWVRMVVRRMWIVFNCQLQWSACVLDHTVYLEERMWYWPLAIFILFVLYLVMILLLNQWAVWGLPRLGKCCGQGCRWSPVRGHQCGQRTACLGRGLLSLTWGRVTMGE